MMIPMTPYTIPIPEPVLPGNMEQLAQITVPDGQILQVLWMRKTRQAVSKYAGRWYIQSDQNIMTAIAQIIGYKKTVDMLAMNDLVVFEIAGRGYDADNDLIESFRGCDWSDYASDKMVFQCTISEKNAHTPLSNKNRIVTNPIRDNVITDYQRNIIDKNRVPILKQSFECSCSGCGLL